jgi:hypothetical protein
MKTISRKDVWFTCTLLILAWGVVTYVTSGSLDFWLGLSTGALCLACLVSLPD